MIKLDLAREPYWIDLAPGARVKVRPCETMILSVASAELRRLPDDTPEPVRFAELSAEVARLAIIEWEGFGDLDGAVIEPTPAAIDGMMRIYTLAKAFTAAYVIPALLVSAEKNG